MPTLWQLSRLILVVGGGLWVVGCGLLGVAVIAVTVTVVVIVVVVALCDRSQVRHSKETI